MSHFDIFNGDADGMCSLRQLRLAEPCESIRITGLKREINLLERAQAAPGDSVTVLDISLDVNRAALLALLERGVRVSYFDHHGAAEIPCHPLLAARIDRSPDICTGMIVDRYLHGRYGQWAVTAAFGDNLRHAATALARRISLADPDIEALRELGECLNYNAYGNTPSDPVIHPDALYSRLERYANPFDFIRAEPVFALLRDTRRADLERALRVPPARTTPTAGIYLLPDAAWSRRVRGEFCNLLATREPQRSHAVLVPDSLGGFTVGIRVPAGGPRSAHEICARFPTGGGRAAAAGINHLPEADLERFCRILGTQ